jgi:Protein of unknown function (DUF3011)
MRSHGGDCRSAASEGRRYKGWDGWRWCWRWRSWAHEVWAQQTIGCSSDDGKKHHCNAETRAGVQMVKQRSGSPCIQDQTWGYDNQGIWVDRGCRADFLLAGNAGPGYGGGRR